jgi:hypothetical protein
VRIWLLVADQVKQQGVLARRQGDRLAVPGHPFAGRIEHHAGVFEGRRRSAAGTPDQGPQAGLQLGEVEGLGQVIIGAGIEAGDLVGTAVAGREDQHRQRVAALPQIGFSTESPLRFGRPRSRTHA